MTFASPLWLLALLLIPLALAAWLESRRRGPRYPIRFTALPTLREAVGVSRVPAWRPYVPMTLMLASVAALVVALARPEKTVAVPIERASIMLVTDHSRSMEADDVAPDRLSAAQAAARTFLRELPKQVRVGVVTYSTAPDAVQTPTTDHAAVERVVDGQVPDGATATGDALNVALNSLTTGFKGGKHPPAAIVLLSDGKTTTGIDPIGVAIAAGQQKVPIYTVALGTNEGVVTAPGFGGYIPVPPDPETLSAIARESGGKAYTAQDQSRLSDIYKGLGSKLGSKKSRHETTAGFAIAGALLLLVAAATSVRFAPALP